MKCLVSLFVDNFFFFLSPNKVFVFWFLSYWVDGEDTALVSDEPDDGVIEVAQDNFLGITVSGVGIS